MARNTRLRIGANTPAPTLRVMVLPGDGIGPEVVTPAVAVLTEVASHLGITLDLTHNAVGVAAIERCGQPLAQRTLVRCRGADAVLFGAVGAQEGVHPPNESDPGAALLTLRKDLGLSVNLRPVRAFPAGSLRSSLRSNIIRGTDFIIVRELLGGAYFGEHGRDGDGGLERAFDTITYTRDEIARVVRFALELARMRKRYLVSVDKANVLWSSQLWREVTQEVAASYPDVTLEHHLVDSFALLMLERPNMLDVVVTENLLGDILSDAAAAISGSIGMLASASINPAGGPILYEPCHGTAPRLAGRGIANPIGAILCVGLLFEYSLGNRWASLAIRRAVDVALRSGVRTPDLGGHSTTQEMTDAVVGSLRSAMNTDQVRW